MIHNAPYFLPPYALDVGVLEGNTALGPYILTGRGTCLMLDGDAYHSGICIMAGRGTLYYPGQQRAAMQHLVPLGLDPIASSLRVAEALREAWLQAGKRVENGVATTQAAALRVCAQTEAHGYASLPAMEALDTTAHDALRACRKVAAFFDAHSAEALGDPAVLPQIQELTPAVAAAWSAVDEWRASAAKEINTFVAWRWASFVEREPRSAERIIELRGVSVNERTASLRGREPERAVQIASLSSSLRLYGARARTLSAYAHRNDIHEVTHPVADAGVDADQFHDRVDEVEQLSTMLVPVRAQTRT